MTMEHVPLSVKLRTWSPQVAMIAIATGSGMAIAAVSSIIAIIPLAVTVAISGIVLLVTSMAKVTEIEDNGWPEFNRTCVKCRRLEADLKKERLEHGETRKALVELKLP